MEKTELTQAPDLSNKEFDQIRSILHHESGIALADDKRMLVASRLCGRLRHYNLDSFELYLQKLQPEQDSAERDLMVDLLTTNETYFYREPGHFDYLRDEVCRNWNKARPLRVWSAACSSGEEPYSIAMVLTEHMSGRSWEVFASDISSSVLKQARNGVYQQSRARGLPRDYLIKYCLQGVRSREGVIKVHSSLRDRVVFQQLNLMTDVSKTLGKFDVVFLRNVLIYFNKETCSHLINTLSNCLHADGLLIVSHTETLHGMTNKLTLVKPSIYRKS